MHAVWLKLIFNQYVSKVKRCSTSHGSILFFVIFLLLLVLEAANPSFGRKEERHEQTQDRPAMLGTELGTALSGDRPAKKRSSDAEARPPGAPIKMVDGRPWSPGVCRSMHLLG